MQINDRASELEALHRDRALAVCLAQQSIATEVSADVCQNDDCQMPIPDARRRAVPGVQFCIRCQTRREMRGRP